ncbi:type III effector HrpK domain-containing protein [Erwinia amylovora]
MKNGLSTEIQFGHPTSAAAPAVEQSTIGAQSDAMKQLASVIANLLKKATEEYKSEAAQTSAASASSRSPSTPVECNSATRSSSASPSTETASDANAAFIDNSGFSSPEALKRFDPLVAGLPPEQREQAAKALNRPIAAAKMAASGGPDAEKAKAWINANPALKTAVDVGKDGGRPDGKITTRDYKAFAKNMEKAANSAAKDIHHYLKAHPNADPQSLQMVISAATLRANEPLARAAALNSSGKVDKYITSDALGALLLNNNGLSPALRQSAKTFNQPGLLNLLDQGGLSGKKLALHSPDKKISSRNIDDWISKQAPTSGGTFASLLSDAATRNAVAGVDISRLNADVFAHPQTYSGAQKAAVMVKLQETLQQVNGGSSLRKVDKTSAALQEKIGQLQNDADVKKFMDQAVPAQEKSIIAGDPSFSRAAAQRYQDVCSGQSLQQDMLTARSNTKKGQLTDYSTAIGNLAAEVKMQHDIRGDSAALPTGESIVSQRPDLQQELTRSYDESFVQGKAVEQGLGNKKANVTDLIADVERQKSAYEAALPGKRTLASHDATSEATLQALKTAKKGICVLKTLVAAGTLPKGSEVKSMSGKLMFSQLRENIEKQTSAAGLGAASKAKLAGGGVMSVAGMLSLSSQLKAGDKAGAVKTLYDGIKGSAELGKLGYNALARDASAGLGRMAGAVAGRVVGMVAGETAGMAAASTIGAAAGPIGWAIDAAMGIGFGIKAIVDAVNRHKEQKTFDHNVDPTLKQFGIPLAH